MAATQVSCGGYCASYAGGPKVEARHPIATPNPNLKKVVLTILIKCLGHSISGTGISTVSKETRIDAATITNILDAVNRELERRGLPNSSFTPVLSGLICYPNVISEINKAVSRMRTFSATNPTTGKIMTASTDPNPAILTLNALVTECMCYTDCRGYSVCYCYGHCNNY